MWGVPIKHGEEIIGSLIAHRPIADKRSMTKDNPFRTGPHAKEMEALLTHLGALMEDKWASQKEVEEITDELTQSFEDLNLYSRIATRIKTLRFSNTMLKDLTEELLETMRSDLAFAILPDRIEYNVLVHNKDPFERTAERRLFIENLIKAIPEKGRSLKNDYFIVNDSRTTEEFASFHSNPYRYLAVRMRHNENVYGWLGLVSFNLKEIFRKSELRLMSSMAEQLAVVMANTDLYQDLERFVINVVKSLVYAIEAKDRYTRGHSERVNRYSMLMAEHLQIDEEQKKVLYWSSILHDVGKIGIPEAILNKPGPLNDDEYRVIKSHPQKGYDILQPLEQLASSLPGILHHHERYDGGGYPHGLKGEEIPLMARIIAVADTFDAITSDRAYRPGKPEKDALAIIEKVAGTQLDPHLVEVFLDVTNKDLAPVQKSTQVLAA
jgi:HD-GYP domain-containing protein (c-di-GMP phosphodiesterase class II)